MSTFEPSASARPFVMSGMALATPPVPVDVPTPVAVRRNHSSSVNVAAFRPGAAPNVTYWVDPFSTSEDAEFAAGVAVAVADAGEACAAVSTATTTYL